MIKHLIKKIKYKLEKVSVPSNLLLKREISWEKYSKRATVLTFRLGNILSPGE